MEGIELLEYMALFLENQVPVRLVSTHLSLPIYVCVHIAPYHVQYTVLRYFMLYPHFSLLFPS